MSALREVAEQLRWQDIADVLFLTFILFRLTLWLRGTVALQVLAGMLVLGIAAFAANQIGLLLTAYLLRALGAIATLIVVVVFRNEIRRALRRVNPLRFWRKRQSAVTRAPAEILAQAAADLGRRRIGALLVLRNVDPIDEHLTGGVALDAQPSVELIESIFQPSGPLHDGATIVEDGKVARAGCFLPLSTSLSLPDSFGSRHRAAAGLTEVCDASVVVVSEERGEVTLFTGHAVERIADASTLEERLRAVGAVRERAPGGASGHRARARLFDVLALIGIFLLVVGAWYAVVGEPGTVVTYTVSIELRNVPENLEVDPPQPDRAAVHLRGPRTQLDAIRSSDVQCWVDLSGAKPGRRRRPLEASAPSGVEITEIVPPAVVVRVRPRR